jgi:ribosome-associated protein
MQSLPNRGLESECLFKASRSSGPGGQNVNKVNSQVELRFNVNESLLLSSSEKLRVLTKLSSRINRENELIIVASEDRSQFRNKEIAIERFYNLLNLALTIPKKRKKTRPSKISQLKRLENKKKHSLNKQLRKPPG